MKEIKLTKAQIEKVKPLLSEELEARKNADEFLRQRRHINNVIWKMLYKMYPEIPTRDIMIDCEAFIIKDAD